MADTQYDQFLREATTCEPESECTLKPDALYGLYTSWCHLTLQEPRPERAFWAAMRERIDPGANGLRMTGPAAADYILSSYPALV
ncbi:hypothetical protein [Arthrobacter sp. D1-17]